MYRPNGRARGGSTMPAIMGGLEVNCQQNDPTDSAYDIANRVTLTNAQLEMGILPHTQLVQML